MAIPGPEPPTPDEEELAPLDEDELSPLDEDELSPLDEDELLVEPEPPPPAGGSEPHAASHKTMLNK
jgi:hypothetical protein